MHGRNEYDVGTLSEQIAIARCYGAAETDVELKDVMALLRETRQAVGELRKEVNELRNELKLPGEPATAQQRRALAKCGLPTRVSAEQATTILANYRKVKHG